MQWVLQVASLAGVVVTTGTATAIDLLLLARSHHHHSFAWRLRRYINWVSLGTAYASMYMGRYNLSVLNTQQYRTRVLGLSAPDFALILTIGFWFYGLAQGLTGLLTDLIPSAKLVVLVSVLLCSLLNLSVGLLLEFSGSLLTVKSYVMAVLLIYLMINYLLQSFGTIATVKVNTRFYSKQERGVFSGVFSIFLANGYWLGIGLNGWALSLLSRPSVLPAFFDACSFSIRRFRHVSHYCAQ